MNSAQHEEEIRSRTRFEFGENWSRFLATLNESKITMAEKSLSHMLEIERLDGKTFLDIGSGSGLFSLAARRLGASVHSFDFDPKSVRCTEELKNKYFPDDRDWRIEKGSALDSAYLANLGQFDVVYSWGVLHHTGAMWPALSNVASCVKVGGTLFIAIYNDQGRYSQWWHTCKKLYNKLPPALRWIVLWSATLRLWGPTTIRDLLRGRPFESWRNYAQQSLRGMSPWRDVVDWVGGLPFEVATPDQVFEFYRARGFSLHRMKTCGGGKGCNEFVLRRGAS